MPLSRREIRTRAVKFAKQWAGATEEEADAKPFWYEFFHVFGIRARTVGSYEVHVRKLDNAELQRLPDGGAVGPADALIMARSGLERVGFASRIAYEFSVQEMLPAVGQGIKHIGHPDDAAMDVDCLASKPVRIPVPIPAFMVEKNDAGRRLNDRAV